MKPAYILASIATAFLTLPVNAATVTFNFSGRIDEVLGSFASSVSEGDTFVGSYTFDSNTPDSDTSDAVGIYAGSGEPYSLNITFGSNSYSYTNLAQVVRSDEFNFYQVQAINGASSTDPAFNSTSLLFTDPIGAGGFISDDLPTLIPINDRFLTKQISFFSQEGNAGFLGRLDPVQPVPEPSEILGTVAVMAMGAYGYMRKRKAKPNVL